MTNVPRLASKVKQLEQFSYVEQFKIYEGEKNVFIMAHFHDILPSSGQTLALAEPEARLYNHPRTRPPSPVPSPGANVSNGYISAIFQQIELKFCMIVI